LKRCFRNKEIRTASKSIGILGGGNHFFELHKIEKMFIENKTFHVDDYLFILHSDSVQLGEYIHLLFSNLSEVKSKYNKIIYRKNQFLYFLKRGFWISDTKSLITLLFSKKMARKIKANDRLGREILFMHSIASVYGKLNREQIIKEWALQDNIKLNNIYSHNHDSILVEKRKNDKNFIVQRNGVQKIGLDGLYMLPCAMGTSSYIMMNSNNEDAFYSANHGTGRVKDKKIAREEFTIIETLNGLKEEKVTLFRLGKGNLAEQNYLSFKKPKSVIHTMESYNLGRKLAKTKPIAVIKG
jgi:RNA-splicing ligase RtcB